MFALFVLLARSKKLDKLARLRNLSREIQGLKICQNSPVTKLIIYKVTMGKSITMEGGSDHK